MIKFLILIEIFFMLSCFNLASFIPKKQKQPEIDDNNVYQQHLSSTLIRTSNGVVESNKKSEEVFITKTPTISSTPHYGLLTTNLNLNSNQQQQNHNQTSIVTISTHQTSTPPPPPTTTTSISTTVLDSDPEIGNVLTTQSNNDNNSPITVTVNTNTDSPTEDNNKIVNLSKPLAPILTTSDKNENIKLNVLFYSVFIVYVSFIKLIYHNVGFIKKNLTEPGILMIFGIFWQLVARQINNSYDANPKFNSRIFFYLFLPSTVLEAGALLSNKWLFLNILPILVHSILGTLLYASALGFTIYSLSSNSGINLFDSQTAAIYNSLSLQYNNILSNENSNPDVVNNSSMYSSTLVGQSGSAVDINNLTFADCLVLGTILSSVDSSTMLGIFRELQINDKLHYLVLGENLLNNAVVIIIFDLLLDFLNETRLTVVKIYFAIIQFFITLFGSIFIGLITATVALISIRLTKRFQVHSSGSTSYQNQCQAMVETLLILKLAYLTYTLATLAGTSSIVSLATFGILQDQYIKHNLNLRSQLTFRQVVLATRTLGSSLVYPLLGMLLVDVANSSQFWLSFNQNNNNILNPLTGGTTTTSTTTTSSNNQLSVQNNRFNINSASVDMNREATLSINLSTSSVMVSAAASVASSKLSQLANQANLHWNFKFLSALTVITLVYRFLIVISLSQFCNLFTSNQLRIKFREQVLLAYGSLKGPLAFALVSRLIEHEEYRGKTMRNKHLFMYTIFITFVSTLLKGCFIRPMVAKMQLVLAHSQTITTAITNNTPSTGSNNNFNNVVPFNSTLVFDEINCKITEYLSDGLNSILGHTKCTFDRFVEFNETTIKPWLSKENTNTNWLSVFYDNLILDETLNANCFYRSAEQSCLPANNNIRFSLTTEQKDFLHIRDGSLTTSEMSNKNNGKEKRHIKDLTSNLVLKTIQENSQPSGSILESSSRMRRQSRDKNPPNELIKTSLPRAPQPQEPPQGPLSSLSSSSLERLQIYNQKVNESPQKDEILKEFVMFNLKLEEARKRRKQRSSTFLVNQKRSSQVEPAQLKVNVLKKKQTKHQGYHSKQRQIRMLSTTSSDADDRQCGRAEVDEEYNRQYKQRQLNNLELINYGDNMVPRKSSYQIT